MGGQGILLVPSLLKNVCALLLPCLFFLSWPMCSVLEILISGCTMMDLMRKRAKIISRGTYGERFYHLHLPFGFNCSKHYCADYIMIIGRQASTRLLCSLFSLPVPPGNPHGAKEDPTTMSGRSVPEYLEHGRIHKLLLFGIEGSGTSTLFKQARSTLFLLALNQAFI